MSEVGVLWHTQENGPCRSSQPSSFLSQLNIGLKIMASSREKNTPANRTSGNRVSHSCDILGVTGSTSNRRGVDNMMQ